jgi:tRNA A37 threonylcarbamoyladenosine modification protein TsaB
VNTLDLIASHYDTVKPRLILLETKRQDFYARYYDADGSPLTEAFASDAETVLTRAPVADFVVGGDCLTRFQQSVRGDFELLENLIQPDPVKLAQMGLAQFEREGEQAMPKPLYLRGADVSKPKTSPRQLEA